MPRPLNPKVLVSAKQSVAKNCLQDIKNRLERKSVTLMIDNWLQYGEEYCSEKLHLI